MLVLGCDVSSSSTGLVLVEGEEMLTHAVWKPPPRVTRPAELLDYERSLDEWIVFHRRRPDLAVVEELSVTRGWKTVRTLSHFESITYLVLERHQIPLRTIKPGAARNWVLDMKITSTKAEVLAEVRRRWPGLHLPPITSGGGDVADAFVMALAGPKALMRQR